MKNANNSDSLIIVKYYLSKVFSLKYFYIFCLIFSLAVAYLYNKHSHRVYEVKASIGQVQYAASSVLASNEMFRGSGSLRPADITDDAIKALTSFSLISSTISSMNLEVGYFLEENNLLRQSTDLYRQSPFIVHIDKSHVQPIGSNFYITFLNDSTFRLTSSQENVPLYNYIDNQIVGEENFLNIDTICQFNTTISIRNFKISITPNYEFLSEAIRKDNNYYFVLYHPEELAKYYLSKLDIRPASFMSSTLDINYSGKNLDKSIIFLNQYLNSFLEENLAKKNMIAVNTINFIDSQISDISDDLEISESALREFRASHQVTDISLQGQRIYSQMERLETERANIELQIRYYDYVLDYLKTNQEVSGLVPPSSANVNDPVMNQLFSELIDLNAERSGISDVSERNVFLAQIENRINTRKKSIMEIASNNLNSLNLTLNEINYRAERLENQISSLPRTEMNLVNIQRRYNLNDAIYTYLLEKRSEAAISLASNSPDYEILEPARVVTSSIIKPKTRRNYLIAIFFAFFIPTVYLMIRDFFFEKIRGIYDLEQLSDRSIAGIIFSNPKKYEGVVSEAPNSAIAESFRNLRSGLFFDLKNELSKAVLVTSSQPQDGKSFISFNLAMSIAAVGLKTVIIDADLRRPVLNNKFKIDNNTGISSFMANNTPKDKIVHKTSIENLFFIPAGPILPNPSELIDSGVLDELFEYLKSTFDFIIIDTSPVKLVSDARQLMRYCSKVLIVSRNNHTRTSVLVHAINSLKADNINYDLVLNDLNIKDSPYSGYTNYYLK